MNVSEELAAVRRIVKDQLLPSQTERDLITSNLKRSLHGRRAGKATRQALKAKRQRWVAGDFVSRTKAVRPSAEHFTATEVAARLDVGRKRFWKIVESKPDLPRVKIGQSVFFAEADLKAHGVLP